MSAYYNENDPFAAQWLRNLISAGHIAPGEVDERSIVDVRPEDVRGFRQCHFFAGIGVWSYALRLAGWPDKRLCWTGSCPCQPFSAAGRRGGFGESRHLWPHWARLIGECRPDVIFGEQVASRDGLAWLDFVSTDLEAAGYAVGALDTCAAGFGAPHIRQRLYFVAESDRAASERIARGVSGTQEESRGERQQHGDLPVGHRGSGATCELADAAEPQGRGRGLQRSREGASTDSGRKASSQSVGDSAIGDMGDARHDERTTRPARGEHEPETSISEQCGGAGPTNGFWRNAEWLPCIDGKARAAKPGIFPLVNWYPNRVGILRAAGNAICAPQAEAFIRAYMELRP